MEKIRRVQDRDSFVFGDEIDHYFYDTGFYRVKTEKVSKMDQGINLVTVPEEEVPFYTKVRAGIPAIPTLEREEFEQTVKLMGKEACFRLFRLVGMQGSFDSLFQRVKRTCSNFNQVLKECQISKEVKVPEVLKETIALLWCDYDTVKKDLKKWYSVYTYYLLRCGGFDIE